MLVITATSLIVCEKVFEDKTFSIKLDMLRILAAHFYVEMMKVQARQGAAGSGDGFSGPRLRLVGRSGMFTPIFRPVPIRFSNLELYFSVLGRVVELFPYNKNGMGR